MSRRRRVVLIGFLLIVVVGVGSAILRSGRERAVEVRIEAVERRDLVATVTASGQISPETSVDVASDITGRITEIAVEEGQWVERNDLLLRIDQTQFQAQVSRAEAALSQTRANAIQSRVNRDQAKRALDRSLELRRTDPNLVSDEQLELAQQQYDVAVANYEAQEYQVAQAQASLEEAQELLSKTVLRAPMTGRITRLDVEEGEVALASTFSRETGLLMTIADLSVIQINVRVDETEVVRLAEGDSAEITIDAFPDTTFVGWVTDISNSAIPAAAGGSGDRAVDYDVEVTLQDPPPDIRPDLSGTAKIITETRTDAISIPIIALTIREHAPIASEIAPAADTGAVDTEGVFVVESGVAYFRPVRVGIAGEEHFEVLDGLTEGDSVVAGPYQAIRDLRDSTTVQPAPETNQERRAIARRTRRAAPETAVAQELPPAETVQAVETPVAAGAPDSGPPPVATIERTEAFTVQVAALSTRAAADAWVTRLREAGYSPDVLEDTDGLFKVRVGRFATRAESEAFARDVRWALGGTPFVVARS